MVRVRCAIKGGPTLVTAAYTPSDIHDHWAKAKIPYVAAALEAGVHVEADFSSAYHLSLTRLAMVRLAVERNYSRYWCRSVVS